LVIIGYVEDKSKGAMLRFQESLPKLPVPSLQETADRYIKSVHPLLSPAEYEATKAAVADFIKPGGQGEELQKRLIAKRERPEIKNWIIDWWNYSAYLAYRDPVCPYVSYFYSFRDDRKRRNPAKRAAAIVTAGLEFKKQVDDGSLEPEYMRKAPICMDSYQYMFNCTRVPAKPADYPQVYPAAEHKYFVVLRKNQIFKVFHEVDGKQLNTSELEQAFNKIYELAETAPAVGALTSENRDIWTDVSLIIQGIPIREYDVLTPHSQTRLANSSSMLTRRTRLLF
jgi:carnitine O-acetyltransferase